MVVLVAKRVNDVVLHSKTARLKLLPRHKPYFRLIGDGVHLGYRRSTVPTRAGTWLVRRYRTEGQYQTKLLGTADDTPDKLADGETVLSFDQANAAAREWARAQAALVRGEQADAKVVTVRTAINAYVATRIARDPRTGRNAELRLTHHVLAAPLADIDLRQLSEGHLEAWRCGLARGGRGRQTNVAALAPATLARLLNDVRAALTAAIRKAKLPIDALTVVKEGLRPPEKPDRARPRQVLPDADVRKLVEAATAHDEDFGMLILMLAATGARLSQLASVTVADLQVAAKRIMVPASKKGKGEKDVTHIAIPLPDDAITRIAPLVENRPGHEALFLHWHHRQVVDERLAGSISQWERVDRRPWKDSGEMTRPWRAALQAAGLPPDLVPYCLRHSSIVRALQAGLPVSLVAKCHDTSVAMIERHYGAFIVDASEDLLRRAVVPMTSAPLEKKSP